MTDKGGLVDQDGYESDLVELGQLSLRELPTFADSALQRSLRRVHEHADNPQDAFAGFNSAL
jgi:FXSXX-COOH protein